MQEGSGFLEFFFPEVAGRQYEENPLSAQPGLCTRYGGVRYCGRLVLICSHYRLAPVLPQSSTQAWSSKTHRMWQDYRIAFRPRCQCCQCELVCSAMLGTFTVPCCQNASSFDHSRSGVWFSPADIPASHTRSGRASLRDERRSPRAHPPRQTG